MEPEVTPGEVKNGQLVTLAATSSQDPAMPQIPPSIWVALAQAIVGLFVAFGLDIPQAATDAIVDLVTALAVAIPTLDVVLRAFRSRYFIAKVKAEAAVAVAQQPPTTGA